MQQNTAFFLVKALSQGEQLVPNPRGFVFILKNINTDIKDLTQILNEHSLLKVILLLSTQLSQRRGNIHCSVCIHPEQGCTKCIPSLSSQGRLSNFVGKDLLSGPGHKNPLIGPTAIRTQAVLKHYF